MAQGPIALDIRPCAGEPELRDASLTGPFAQPMAALADSVQVPPWCGYIGWQDGVPLGFAGFSAGPDADGVVEIGYLTFPPHEGCGVATALAAALVGIARQNGAARVIAHSLPCENASTTVLRRASFRRDGVATDPDEGEVWRWAHDL